MDYYFFAKIIVLSLIKADLENEDLIKLICACMRKTSIWKIYMENFHYRIIKCWFYKFVFNHNGIKTLI